LAFETESGAWAHELASAIDALRAHRERTSGRVPGSEERDFPVSARLSEAVELLSHGLYPRRLGAFEGTDEAKDDFIRARLTEALALLAKEVATELRYWEKENAAPFDPEQAATIIRLFVPELPRLRELIDSDVDAAFLGDPAARTVDEILICYPAAIASLHHRVAHALHRLGAPIVARIISEQANRKTGIDIHPGATIGHSFFIDHGTGVVIGETAIIGDRVRIYQHVTLGARTPIGERRPSPRERYARHPIVENDVVIYAGATILGRVTIGEGSTIGGNVWLLDDVPPHSLVLQPPARVEPDLSRSPRAA